MPDSYDLNALAEAQAAYFREGNTESLSFRIDRLRGLESILTRRSDDLLDALASDLGKPAVEGYMSEVYFSLLEIRLFLKKLPKWIRPRRAGHPFFALPARSWVQREPLGRALIVSPWNYPLQLALSPLIAAVAAGNTVILKPSEFASTSAKLLGEIIAEAFNPQHVAVLQGGPELGEALLELPFETCFFTGSERVGRKYAEAAARNLAPITLELGGKCPCLVLDDAPLETAVERIIATKFFNAGQTCIAPDFVLVPEARRGEFVKLAQETLEKYYSEDIEADLATMIHQDHYERVEKLCDGSAIQVGEDDKGSLRLAPRLLPEATWNSAAMEEEIFGPVLPILGYTSLDETLAELRSRPDPLALYAFTKSREKIDLLLRETRSGSVCFNDTMKQAINLELPFGGVGASGMGRYRGKYGFEAFTYERAITKRTFWKDPFFSPPPYGNLIEKLRKYVK